MSILKEVVIGTIEQVSQEDIVDANLYQIQDFPSGGITNSQMADALTDAQKGFYQNGDVYMCTDNGTYTQKHFYKFTKTDTAVSWVDITDTTKADKVANATSGNFAGLDSNGNLTDSGKKSSDFVSSSGYVPFTNAYKTQLDNTTATYTTQKDEKLSGLSNYDDTELRELINGKQATISDLETIRTNAQAGKTASDTIDTYGDVVTHDADEFATASQGSKADTALQPSDVINNTISLDTDKPLSARVGKELNDRITNLASIGKYLAMWDCTTGLPTTEPTSLPYSYTTGDYYIIKTLASAGGTNYMPNGSSYTGVASTTAYTGTETLELNSFFYYDGTNWTLLKSSGKTVTFASISGNATDNSSLASELNAKADKSSTVSNVSMSGNTLQKTIDGTTTNVTTFGSNAFTSTTIPTNTNQLTNGAGFITANDITGKADKTNTVSNVSYDSTNKKLQKTINGSTTDVVTFGSNAFNSTTIPTTYLKNASVANNTLTLTKQDDTTVTFQGGGDISSKMDTANPIGTGCFILNKASDYNNPGMYSVSVGYRCKATGFASFATGQQTNANGSFAFAAGDRTTASADYSHSEGLLTTAQRQEQFVFGEYNVLDTTGAVSTRGSYVEIVGNGDASTSRRSNARTLDWYGNERLNGTLYVKCNANSTGGSEVATKSDIPSSSSFLNSTGQSNIAGSYELNDNQHFRAGSLVGANNRTNYLSAGAGYSNTSGKYGVKVVCCDQGDCQTGLGQDLNTQISGGYDMCVVGGTNPSGYGSISFVSHPVNSLSYTALGEFVNNNGTVSLNVRGAIKQNGVNVATVNDIPSVPDLTYMAVKNANNNFTTSQTVTGTVTATYFNTNSDQRLKENIKDYKCEKSILDLPVKEFDYISTGEHTIGCIAQDLQEICPEIVTTNKDGYLSIQESKLVYLLLQEVKDLKEEVRKLKGE